MIRNIGISRENQDVFAVDIWNGALSATILSWGAVVQDLRLAGHEAPLVLGFKKFRHYPRYSPYFGAIVGRYANRINKGRATIAGNQHQFDTNFLGKHCLHGGKTSYGVRDWVLSDHAHDFVELRLTDPDGMMGFPGKVDLCARYEITDGATLALSITANCDAPTLFNPAHHSYFCLDDSNDIRGHEICISADHYLPVDDEFIPTGEIAPVTGTRFDLRTPGLIGDTGFDHNFCLGGAQAPLRQVASVRSPKSGIGMQVATTEPGLQFYTGHKLGPPVTGLIKQLYGPFSGLCLEPQVWPDAPNNPHFPDALLQAGAVYHQQTTFAFHRG
jgi:aldose 1-epimerase